MQAAAVGDLGLGLAEFWNLTPAHFMAVWRRFEAREQRLDRRAALIASLLCEINRDSSKKPDPFTIADFMPKTAKKTVPGQGEISEEELLTLPLEQRVAYVCKQRTTQSIVHQQFNVTAALEYARMRNNNAG